MIKWMRLLAAGGAADHSCAHISGGTFALCWMGLQPLLPQQLHLGGPKGLDL